MDNVVALPSHGRPSENTLHPSRSKGELKYFTQSLNICSLCGSTAHRASKCPLRIPDNAQVREI